MFNLENLEERRMLSAVVKFDRATGLLRITGDAKDDNVRVTVQGQPGAPKLGTPSTSTSPQAAFGGGTLIGIPLGDTRSALFPGVTVFENERLIYNSTFSSRENVTSIVLNGGGGADQLEVSSYQNAIPIEMLGGSGDDQIISKSELAQAPRVDAGDDADALVVWLGEGAPLRTIDAGAGDDAIEVTATLTQSREEPAVLGGAGNDRILLTALWKTGFLALGGEGNDVILGSASDDDLLGEAGNDQIYAGAGDDRLHGGVGDDLLMGDGGNDFINHGGGTDVVDGGDGFDTAVVGGEDRVANIELVFTALQPSRTAEELS